MKNLPATIGLMIVLFVFFLFQGNTSRSLQANPMNQDELVKQLRQDTFPPKARDTINPARKAHHEKREMKRDEKREMKKDMKKHHRDSSYRKDTIM